MRREHISTALRGDASRDHDREITEICTFLRCKAISSKKFKHELLQDESRLFFRPSLPSVARSSCEKYTRTFLQEMYRSPGREMEEGSTARRRRTLLARNQSQPDFAGSPKRSNRTVACYRSDELKVDLTTRLVKTYVAGSIQV